MIEVTDNKGWFWELQPLLPYERAEHGPRLTEVWCQVMTEVPDELYGYSVIPIPVFTKWWETDENGAQPLLA